MAAIFSVWIRYVVLLAARGAGCVYRLLFSGWRRPLAALALVWASLRLSGALDLLDDSWWREPANAVWLLLALGVFRWLWLARKRLVIANFTDYTTAQPTPVPGLSTLLQVEVARLYDLLRLVDEQRAVPDAVKGPQNASFAEDKSLDEAEGDKTQITDGRLDLPAPIRAEDLSNVLDAAVSIEATMNLGPVTIPIGAIASILGRLAQGPRLVGSVHHTADQLIVSARTVGDRVGHTWRVDRPLQRNEAGEPTVRAEDLLDELAVRVLTDLALESSRWQATWAYVDGLRAYRECLRTKKDRRINLERAKACFLKTIAEDDRFDRAHYNLGVVATDLQQWEAAEAAFLGAIDQNTRRWDPYYGLAQLYFVRSRYEEMLPLCGRMIRLHDHRAESHHLRALANRRTQRVTEAMADRKAAVRWAWVRLCLTALTGQESKAAVVAGTSLRNLGVMRAYQAKERWSPETPDASKGTNDGRLPFRLMLAYIAAGRELRQGMFLRVSDAELHFELGKVYAARRKWSGAIRELERAVEMTPDRPRFWVQLARAYTERLAQEVPFPQVRVERSGVDESGGAARRESERTRRKRRERAELWRKALSASMRAYEEPSKMVDNGFERLAKLYEPLSARANDARFAAGREEEEEKQRERLQRLGQVLQLRDFETRRRTWTRAAPDDEELEAQLAMFAGDALWEDVQVSLEIARRYLSRPAGDRLQKADAARRIAARLLGRMDLLHEYHRPEIRRQDVYAVIARVLHAAGCPKEALPHAERAVRYNPLSYEARTVLADVQLTLGHVAEAETAWRGALVAEPERPYPMFRLGESLVKIALSCHAPERRRTMLEEATGHFGRALQLLELQEARHGDDGDDVDAIERDLTRGEVAYWLGRARFDLDQYEEAVTALQLAVLMRYQTPLARLRLGVAYVRLGHFCEGESEFEEILHPNGRPAGDDDRPMVGPPGDELSWREIEVWATIYRAGARIERNAGVNEAIADIENVAERIESLPEAKQGSARAACADWQGWGWFRLNEVDRAIQYLTRSVDLEPTGEGYLHLALVHAHRAVYGRQAEQRRREEERARYYAELAGRMGLGAQQRNPLDEMLRRLDSEKELRAAAHSRSRKSEAQPVA